MKISVLHQTARTYAESGLPVFPCLPGTKKPACPNGYKDASASLEQIDAWWAAMPDANVALCPEDCGWCVIDLEHDAPPEWRAKFPKTFTNRSPKGGWHLFYEGSLPSTVKKLEPHTDTRGRGGYVLVAPSVWDGDASWPAGGRYSVEHDIEIEPLPGWVGDHFTHAPKMITEAPADLELDTRANIRRAVARLKVKKPVAEGAGSDQAAYETAEEMKDLGLSEVGALQVMMEYWRCDTKEEWWVTEKVANAYRYGQNAPGVQAVKPGSEVFTATEKPTVNGASIVEKDTNFLWYPYLPAGSMTLLGGRGGHGKGLIASSLAATVTTGGTWPGSSERAPKGRVLWCEAEDAPSQTLKPRWVAAGADCRQIELVTPKTFPAINLKSFIQDNEIRLVVFSPAVSFMKGLEDINSELGVRQALELVQEAVDDTACAVLCINHINKKTELDSIDRVLGSVAWTNFVRSVLFIARGEDEARFVHAKHNLSIKGADLLYTPRSVDTNVRGQRVRVEWSVPETNIDAGAIYDRKKKKEATPAVDEAMAWVRSFLIAGPKASVEVHCAGEQAGHSSYAIKQAIKGLGIKSEKFGMSGGWTMSLPE